MRGIQVTHIEHVQIVFKCSHPRQHFFFLGARQKANILADRLKTLVAEGIISKADDPSHKQKSIYSLTEQGIELLPVLAQMSVWGRKYLPVSEELSIRAQLLEEGGPTLWAEFMEELREIHLGTVRKKKPKISIGAQLQAAYELVMEKRHGTAKA